MPQGDILESAPAICFDKDSPPYGALWIKNAATH